MKFCVKCQAATERYSTGRCKPCRSVRNAAWKAANPERVKAADAARYATNPERAKAATSAWRKANPGRKKAQDAAQRAGNPEKVRISSAKWYKAHPERARAHNHNRRARKRNAEGSHTPEDIKRLLQLQNRMCIVCRTDISQGYHVDHILPLVLGGGNNWYNLQLLCPTCNLQKGAKHPIDFMQQKGFLL